MSGSDPGPEHEGATLRTCSHLLLATADVPRMMRFVREIFGLEPRFENAEFGEFVLGSGFRIAFFVPKGTAAKHFAAEGSRATAAFGMTASNVDALHARVEEKKAVLGLTVSGPPKSHPWGEKSFLLVDPDGNRWEIAESPSKSGMLVDL